jgi:hypothetical protein
MTQNAQESTLQGNMEWADGIYSAARKHLSGGHMRFQG